MVARQLLAAGQKLAERVVEKQLDLVNEGRRLLPLSRGGLPPERTLVAPRQAEPLTQTRLPPLQEIPLVILQGLLPNQQGSECLEHNKYNRK